MLPLDYRAPPSFSRLLQHAGGYSRTILTPKLQWRDIVLFSSSISDWVAVKLVKENSTLMYMASINDVMEQDNNVMYSVSFLKQHTDGSYYWPNKGYICDVDDTDVLKMSIPSEDIGLLSGKAAIVRVKLSFDSGEINAARSAFRVSIKNLC